MNPLIAQIISMVAPIVADIIKKYREEKGREPTTEEIKAEFFANVDLYLGEGSAWKAAHPEG